MHHIAQKCSSDKNAPTWGTTRGQSRLRDDGEVAVGFARGADGDLHVLAERGEKLHQAAHGKTARTIAHQQGDMRLLDSENLARLGLSEAALLDQTVDLQCPAGLEQFLLGMGKPQVRGTGRG